MNKLKISIISLALIAGFHVKAQKADGSTKSLLKAEKEFVSVAKNNANQAFKKFAADKALVFRPNPVDAKNYYSNANGNQVLNYKPVYAQVSKSRNWGIIYGSQKISNDSTAYGHYLSVWKTKDDKWQYVLNIDAQTSKPLKNNPIKAIEPKGTYTPKLMVSDKNLKARLGIITTSESTLNTLFKTYGANAFLGFLTDNSALMFPGTELIEGKNNIQGFNSRVIDKINLKPIGADRAVGDDLAYSYGLASIDYKGMELRESFNYVYIWERQTDGAWSIIAQIYTVAER